MREEFHPQPARLMKKPMVSPKCLQKVDICGDFRFQGSLNLEQGQMQIWAEGGGAGGATWRGNQKELVKQKPLSQKPSLGTGQERRGLTSRAIRPAVLPRLS